MHVTQITPQALRESSVQQIGSHRAAPRGGYGELFICTHRSKVHVIALITPAREPGLLESPVCDCNQEEYVMATRKSAAKGPVRTKHSHNTKSGRQSAAGKGTTAGGTSSP